MSISRTSPPMWRQPRTLAILFWTGFGFAPFAALLLLVGSSDFTIKLALIAGLGSVVLIGLSVTLRTDAATVERDVYANMADVEAETRRALNELRNEIRRSPPREATAVGSAAPRQALPSEEREEPRRPRPIQQASAEYFGSRGEEREPAPVRAEEREPLPPRLDERDAEHYLPETTAVPRQRWDDEYHQPGHEPTGNRDQRSAGRRGQAVEAWRAEEPAASPRRSRGVENGWADEVYNSGSQPRASRSNGADPSGGRGRHYRDDDPRSGEFPSRRYRDDDDPLSGEIPSRRYRDDDDPLSGEIPSRHDTGPNRHREYASDRPRGNGTYMDTYYGESRR
ncbi:MAG: hypothetical protein ACRD0P_06200 [Stackebrandtia sp.]